MSPTTATQYICDKTSDARPHQSATLEVTMTDADLPNPLASPPAEEIICVDCGGPCHLLTPAREDALWFAGDIVAYRCRDCRDRWDIELPPIDDTND